MVHVYVVKGMINATFRIITTSTEDERGMQ